MLRNGTDARPLSALYSIFETSKDPVPAEAQPEPEPTDIPPTVRPQPSARHAPRPSVSTPSQPTASSLDHTASDHEICSRPPTKSREDTGSSFVYQWTDETGQIHMADTPPASQIAEVIDISGIKRDFTYDIIYDGVSLPRAFEGKITAASKRIYDVWHFFLGEEDLRQAHIKLRVIGGPDRYNNFRAKRWPGSKPTYGFYSAGANEAYVQYDPANSSQTERTSFHEISHLVTTSHLGPTPPWLTEGLAEYFETMQVKGQTGTVYPNTKHLQLLRRSGTPRLREFLAIEKSEWNGPQRDLNYATAWALMHFLMEGSPGMYAMQEVIRAAHKNFCKPFAADAALNDAYPGGLDRLEADWRSWLTNMKYGVQQT